MTKYGDLFDYAAEDAWLPDGTTRAEPGARGNSRRKEGRPERFRPPFAQLPIYGTGVACGVHVKSALSGLPVGR